MGTIKLVRSKDRPYIWMPNTLSQSIMGILDKCTSYEMTGYEYTTAWAEGWDGKVRLLKQARNKSWYFPIGLLPQITQTLKAFGYSVEIAPRQKPNNFQIEWTNGWPGPELRDYQQTTLNETMVYLNKGEGCIINLPTGSGKTIIGMRLIQELSVRTLITINNKELMKQWKEEIKETLHIIPALYGGGKNKEEGPITIAMIQTLAKDTKLNLNQFDLLLCDECHHYSAPIFSKVAMKCNAFYRVGMSATTSREDGAELKFIGGIGKIIKPIDAKQLIDQGYLTKPELIIHRPPSPAKLGRSYNEEYTNGIILNERRNHMISEIVRKYVSEGKQVYINVKIKKHGERLAQLIGCQFIHASSKNRVAEIEAFAKGKSRAICSTLLGEGIDIPGIDVIVMASAGKSATATIQRAGRVLRLKEGKSKATIVDFADSGKRLRQHYEKRRQTYKEILGI